MKSGKVFLHIIIVLAGVFVLLGIPFFSTEFFRNMISGTDATTSASVVLEAPSGEFVVMINDSLHEDTSAVWADFFMGSDYQNLFEDIDCWVAQGDTAAYELAKSYASKLPENQMTVKVENALFMLSRADAGSFDVIIMSQEYAKSYDASTVYKDNVTVLTVSEE